MARPHDPTGLRAHARPMSLPDFAEALGDGVLCIDTGFHRPRFDAAYLIVDEGRAAFIDTGTNYAVPRLLATLEALGLPRDAVDWVIPTHVHLDHAGGAGLLMRELPAARLLVHPRGVRHMIDPTALYDGALAVYGERRWRATTASWCGVDAARASPTHDGMTLHVGRRCLHFVDTPGHARHHHCIWDEASARLVHRRHLRPELPRVRHRAGRGSCPVRRRCSSTRRRCARRSRGCCRPGPAACTSRTTAASAMSSAWPPTCW